MYPTPYCPYCQAAQPPVTVEEDTKHMLTCPNRQSRLDAADNLRAEVLRRIRKRIEHPNGLTEDVFPPLGIITDNILQRYQQAITAGAARLKKCVALKKLHQNITKPYAHYGVLPQGICQALIELGISKSKAQKLTDKIAIMAQRALVDELNTRKRNILQERNQQRVFKENALPPAANTDEQHELPLAQHDHPPN